MLSSIFRTRAILVKHEQHMAEYKLTHQTTVWELKQMIAAKNHGMAEDKMDLQFDGKILQDHYCGILQKYPQLCKDTPPEVLLLDRQVSML